MRVVSSVSMASEQVFDYLRLSRIHVIQFWVKKSKLSQGLAKKDWNLKTGHYN